MSICRNCKHWYIKDQFMVNAGCHSFTVEEALDHWGAPGYPNQERGNLYVRHINFMAKDAEDLLRRK